MARTRGFAYGTSRAGAGCEQRTFGRAWADEERTELTAFAVNDAAFPVTRLLCGDGARNAPPLTPPSKGGEREMRGLRWRSVHRSDYWRVAPFTPL